MTIDLTEIKHLEELARIALIDKERKQYSKQLSSILEYVSKLQEVNIEGVEPTGHATEGENVWRDDEVIDCPLEEVKRILDNAPELKDKLIKVKGVFK
ncbi:Asp-tRNA(Asn)/Glu-tRNA(Gln) amidotransferase subunit GatC [Candidatus Saccharibacteria bacterium]|nr:Asp-tRNA(Asn)/Glu-tRNA(Gln) amidotransferase subunit GatC [Candidatus Saccharibacteria bacterium]NIV04344.1 Asp-tRNA(Asn)/Glu-tRNA(Gln) amidotransferase subunit GatC [Calditrichia bacterium]NIS38885.1 Asp-tRNA(Asn)/Glu-tRNA(Gln) amidotransferase subunit GatC [Candidatus Saccharibacteria bacterium]NIV72869.1 Asp-tRNA(Asn)/Glu-tRNA(Gln) amidotransferase subunit GatC [Calditrichia bacterium]NIW00084.1 Asp-tRNA(Asn)/Glu-tRNA(Gln) amidotransferase subunit GatC [Candidatus Saccharibacteria bacteri